MSALPRPLLPPLPGEPDAKRLPVQQVQPVRWGECLSDPTDCLPGALGWCGHCAFQRKGKGGA